MYARVPGKPGGRGFYRDRTVNLAGIVMTRLRNETISTTAKFSSAASSASSAHDAKRASRVTAD